MKVVPYRQRSADIAQILKMLQIHEVQYVLTSSIAPHAHGVEVGTVSELHFTLVLHRDNLQRLAI